MAGRLFCQVLKLKGVFLNTFRNTESQDMISWLSTLIKGEMGFFIWGKVETLSSALIFQKYYI